jgi:hypothetical protein
MLPPTLDAAKGYSWVKIARIYPDVEMTLATSSIPINWDTICRLIL